MTTLIQFQPTPFAPFSFITTLDGQQYTVTVSWNLFGQRWYFNVADLNNNPVVSEALIGSPAALTLSSLTWNQDGLVTAVTATRHGFVHRATIDLTVAGCAPAAYNGQVQAYVVNDYTLFWQLLENPGPATRLGTVSYDIDLVEQYFQTSTVVYRESTQNFEINP